MGITPVKRLKGVNNLETPSTEVLLSIIIPCFNVEDKIGGILDCLKRQTDKHFEIIFVNDGSADRTADIIERNQSRINCEGVRLINQDNQGPAIARNIGLKYAKGKYVYFPDADDIISDHLVECLESGLFKTGNLPNIVAFGYKVVDSPIATLADPKFDFWRIGTIRKYLNDATTRRVGFGYLWNKFIQREFITKNNICFEKFSYDEDAIFLSRLYLNGHTISFSEDVLYHYVQYSSSLTHAKKDYYESVRSLSRLNQVTDELSQKYGLSENGLQLRVKLRLVFAITRAKKFLSNDELSELRDLITSITAIHQFISTKDRIAALYFKIFGVFGVRMIQSIN
ncbi:glycosyltransferase [Lactiplantibacillus plantarum]|uniref:glycosyltransferase n=1 Tax=Lactiplantibacillus plantarum TaxID=1590 RepID=UPI0021F6DE93|nr:glycosyltransferase [Lactiplantibacillus plantarum]MCW0154618.1 glycosyltransferase [Lactiplantibacillus plantarum]